MELPIAAHALGPFIEAHASLDPSLFGHWRYLELQRILKEQSILLPLSTVEAGAVSPLAFCPLASRTLAHVFPLAHAVLAGVGIAFQGHRAAHDT